MKDVTVVVICQGPSVTTNVDLWSDSIALPCISLQQWHRMGPLTFVLPTTHTIVICGTAENLFITEHRLSLLVCVFQLQHHSKHNYSFSGLNDYGF